MTEILFKSEILKGFLGLNKIIPYNMVEILSAFAYNRHLNKISGKEWTREKAIKLFDKMYTASNIGFKNNFFGEELVNYLVYRSFFNFEKDVFCHEKYGEYLVARYYCKTVFDEDGNINADYLEAVDKAVIAALSNELTVVIDLHHYGELKDNVSANESHFRSLVVLYISKAPKIVKN